MIVIGIDCATAPKKVGIARGEWGGERARLVAAEIGRNSDEIVATIAGWLPRGEPALLALDAPLGWPRSLGSALVGHSAGKALACPPNLMFRRGTDRFVRSEVGKQSLDVGADRIARTAHAALRLLEAIREATGHAIPLAWSPEIQEGPAAIEVYPAATLMARGGRASGYKKRKDRELRAEMLQGLERSLDISAGAVPLLTANADALDAAVCVLAACDFLDGRALAPRDLDEARREGWIWVAEAPTRRDRARIAGG